MVTPMAPRPTSVRLRRALLTLALAACATASPTRPETPDRVPFGPDDREAELAFVRDALRDSYAHLEVKGVDLDALFARYRAAIRDADTWSRYERVMVAFVSELHDGHLVWRRRRGPSERPRRIVRLGLETRFAGDALIVTEVWRGSAAERAGLRTGDRILGVDGETVEERFTRYATLRSWSRPEAARHDFAAEWPAARIDRDAPPPLRSIERERPDGSRDRLSVAPETEPRPAAPPFSATGDLVTIRSLRLHAAEVAADAGQIRGSSIVVDLRGNAGGFDQAAITIASALASAPVTAGTRRVRLSRAARDARSEWRELAADPDRPGWSLPLPLAATGGAPARRIAVLVDAGCQSSCELLALLLRAAGARLVGETTGGSSGAPIPIVLPKSGARIEVPVWALYDAAGRPIEGRGVEPDEILAATRDDWIAGRDPLLERGRALVTP